MKWLRYVMLATLIGASPAAAEIEQCRFIQARPDREACYQRQEAALDARRKPETPDASSDTRTLESLRQMRRDDDAVYQSLRSICRGC